MYRVMVVDDEKFVRKSIINRINWQKLNLELAAEAANGEKAYSLMAEVEPHILLVDIKMPLMNGIELIRKAKKAYPKTQFIVLSGYDDFEYTKEAIKLGVTNYIKKPIDEDELEETLSLIIKELDSKFVAEKRNKILIRQAKNGAVALEEKILNQLIHGSDTTVKGDYKFYGQKFGLILFYETQNKDNFSFYSPKKYVERNIKNMMKIMNYSHIDTFVFTDKYCKELFYVLLNDDKINTNILKSIALSFKKMILDNLSRDSMDKMITCAVSPICSQPKHLHDIFTSGFSILKHKILLPESVILDESSILVNTDKNFFNYILSIIKLIQQAVENRDFEYIDHILTGVLEQKKSRKFTIEILESFLVSIGTILKNIVISYDIEQLNLRFNEIFAPDYILKFNNLNDLKEDIYTSISELFSNHIQLDEKNVIKQIENYISKNYYEDLTLSYIAKKFYLNPSYLSLQFKNKTGINISKYIEDTRIEVAKQLLSNTDITIRDAAVRVGYNDSNYFSKVFKKNTGMSPSGFRRIANRLT